MNNPVSVVKIINFISLIKAIRMTKVILVFLVPSFWLCQIAWASSNTSTETAIAHGKRLEKRIAEKIKSSQTTAFNPLSDNKELEHATVQVTISGIKNPVQKNNAQAFLDLYAENGKKAKNPVYIDYLAQKGIEQIQQSLKPFGYYLSEVKLAQKHIEKQSKSQWRFNYQVLLGKPVIVREKTVTLSGAGKNYHKFTQTQQQFPLKIGDRLEQTPYSDFKSNLSAIATNDGFFDGNFSQKAIIIGENYDTADIQLNYDTGVRYLFDHIVIQQDFLDQDVFERYLLFDKGTPYSTQSITDLQRDLYNSGYVKTIDIEAKPNKQTKTVPVKLIVTPKKNKQHKLGIGYSTDSGIHGRYDFNWRWVNRRGHKFNSELFVAQKLQKAGIKYLIPGKKPATDNYLLFANFKRDRRSDTQANLWNFGAAYQDQKGNFRREFGIKWQQEDFSLGNDSGNIGLLTPYAKFTYLRTDNPLDTSNGLLLNLTLTGADKKLLSDTSFLQAIANAKYIKRFGEKNKVSLAASIGRTWTENFHKLPASYRFFTGGDRTIRGYKFNDIGDLDSSGKVIGGNKMFYTSAEYEYFFRPKIAAAVFVDAGDAYSSGVANVKVGAGFGVHYYSPIGPIKINIAHGFDKPGSNVRLHLSIGPELP